eukprot:m51a1_g10819 hypothetical protein (134) ;mRNA; f:57209-57852
MLAVTNAISLFTATIAVVCRTLVAMLNIFPVAVVDAVFGVGPVFELIAAGIRGNLVSVIEERVRPRPSPVRVNEPEAVSIRPVPAVIPAAAASSAQDVPHPAPEFAPHVPAAHPAPSPSPSSPPHSPYTWAWA